MRRILLSLFLVLADWSSAELVQAQDQRGIWREFIEILKDGRMTVDRIRPYEQLGDQYKATILGFLETVRTEASPDDWITEPEVVQTGNRIQYIVPWSTGDEKVSYCFSFVTDGNRWYFQHLESIFVRLDKIQPPPVSTFPDVSERHKAWAREELYWSFVVQNVYLPVAARLGKDAALDLLKDGGGYFVGARSWVPFVSPPRAFILYLCWEQANLRGNQVTLEKLSDREAVVRLNSIHLALYSRASHLRSVISFEDYRRIFETIWQDRATNAGWNLSIAYSPDDQVTLAFTPR